MRALLSILITICAALAGCSGGAGTMDGIMRSWHGATLDQVIAQWGYPQQEQTIAGRKLYRWYYEKQIALPATATTTVSTTLGVTTARTNIDGGGILHGACTRTLEVNTRNIVVASEWAGNNCPFMDLEGFEYGRWRRR